MKGTNHSVWQQYCAKWQVMSILLIARLHTKHTRFQCEHWVIQLQHVAQHYSQPSCLTSFKQGSILVWWINLHFHGQTHKSQVIRIQITNTIFSQMRKPKRAYHTQTGFFFTYGRNQVVMPSNCNDRWFAPTTLSFVDCIFALGYDYRNSVCVIRACLLALPSINEWAHRNKYLQVPKTYSSESDWMFVNGLLSLSVVPVSIVDVFLETLVMCLYVQPQERHGI